MAKMTKIVFDRTDNVEKGEKSGDKHFSLFPQCFHRASSKLRTVPAMCGKWLKDIIVQKKIKNKFQLTTN